TAPPPRRRRRRPGARSTGTAGSGSRVRRSNWSWRGCHLVLGGEALEHDGVEMGQQALDSTPRREAQGVDVALAVGDALHRTGDEPGGDERVDVGAQGAVGDAVDDHLLPAVEDLTVGLDQADQVVAVADLRPAV